LGQAPTGAEIVGCKSSPDSPPAYRALSHLIHLDSSREAVDAFPCKASGPGATKAYSSYVEEQRGRITQQIQVDTASQQNRGE
jgi:hypothetical protein